MIFSGWSQVQIIMTIITIIMIIVTIIMLFVTIIMIIMTIITNTFLAPWMRRLAVTR